MPSIGLGTFTQSVAAPSGDVPFGFRSRPSVLGRRTGRSSTGTGISVPSAAWMIGIGVPQKRWREISQSRRR